jgi:predicted DNA-binding protein (UPF0251 family)
MAIVDAMPEDKWDYRPVKEVRSFREMALHLAQDGYSHMGYVAGKSREESAKLTAKYDKLKTKAEIMQALKDSYEYGDKILDTLTDQNAMEMVSGMRNQQMTRVEAALSQVSEPFRTTLILRDIEGFVYEEVAEIQGVNLGTVKSRLVRGRALLKAILVEARSADAVSMRRGFEVSVGEEAR